MFRNAAALTLTLLVGNALNVSAAEQMAAPNAAPPLLVSNRAMVLAANANEAQPPVTLASLARTPKRPTLLPALYGTFATLQVMDVISTKKALSAGGYEANPLMRRGNIGTTIAIKAASATAAVYLVEKIWKKNRVGAIVVMAALNGAGAAVVAHNNRIARR